MLGSEVLPPRVSGADAHQCSTAHAQRSCSSVHDAVGWYQIQSIVQECTHPLPQSECTHCCRGCSRSLSSASMRVASRLRRPSRPASTARSPTACSATNSASAHLLRSVGWSFVPTERGNPPLSDVFRRVGIEKWGCRVHRCMRLQCYPAGFIDEAFWRLFPPRTS